MKIISIVGYPGCGKSELASFLAGQLDGYHIEMSAVVKETGLHKKTHIRRLREVLNSRVRCVEEDAIVFISGLRDYRLNNRDFITIYLETSMKDRLGSYKKGLWALIKGTFRTWDLGLNKIKNSPTTTIIPYRHTREHFALAADTIKRRILQ